MVALDVGGARGRGDGGGVAGRRHAGVGGLRCRRAHLGVRVTGQGVGGLRCRRAHLGVCVTAPAPPRGRVRIVCWCEPRHSPHMSVRVRVCVCVSMQVCERVSACM